MTEAPAHAAGFLRIEHLAKDFDGVRAVDDVSLDIAKGEIFALLGSSGCGKTTLLRMVAGFETPSAGRIVLDGQDLTGLPPYLRPLNMMFQNYALFPHLSVADNIAFGLQRAGMRPAAVAQRVGAMLSLVQLTPLAERKPHQLSGGQQQRVALARSLAKQPQLLLLDEPLGALDKKLREQTRTELVNIIEQVGVTCIMVTHDQDEAMTMASRIGVMSEGRLQQVGTPGELYESPTSRFVADFIGSVNLMDGRVEVDEADHCIVACADCRHYVGHGIAATLGLPVTIALRPEKIRLSRQAPTDASFNAVRARVRERTYFGSHTLYHLILGSGATLKVSHSNQQRRRDDELAGGDEAWAVWSDSAQVVLTR